MSMLNTLFKRWAQLIEKVRPGTGRETGLGHARRLSGAASGDSAGAGFPLLRLPGVTWARWWLFGAKTPW